MLDMVGNHMPWQVYIEVPRPAFGDLVPEFASEMTLYDRDLFLEVTVDHEVITTATWHEMLYDVETNGARHEIQQRVWRIGRGEGTEADFRGEAQADLLRRHEGA
jgi:hypothetical protein